MVSRICFFLSGNRFPIGFQDPATPIMEGIVDLHNYILFYAALVLFFVLWIMINIFYYFNYKVRHEFDDETISYRYLLMSGNSVTHGTTLEIVWTLVPAAILMAIAVPSFALLYSMDEISMPSLVIKAIGHQWYWSYEYSVFGGFARKLPKGMSMWLRNKAGLLVINENFDSINFDSYMVAEDDLSLGQLRLLEVDNAIVLPVDTHIRVIVTATDVLHAWAVPSLGVKVDAVPGRLSGLNMLIKREGVFYGQCSELCGVNHGFMPIVVKAVQSGEFAEWALIAKRAKFRFILLQA